MKTIVSFIALLPLVVFAQNKLPFIQSITSDTLHGKYKQMTFTYDNSNRVTNIIETQCTIKKTAANNVVPSIDTVSIQHFNYNGNNDQPSSRKITGFQFIPEIKASVATYIEIDVFTYKDGKRVQDSIICKENDLGFNKKNAAKNKVYNWQGTLDYSSDTLTYLIDRNYLTRRMYDYKYGSTTELLINQQQNIKKDAEEELIKSHSSSNPPFYTYTKFDKAINPFRYLNISKSFPNEKVAFSYDVDGLIGKKANYINQGYTHFNWYFFNQNNITSYSITRGETDSEIEDVIQLSYTYNQFNLPTQCLAEIRKQFKSDGTLASKHQKRFTFRYRH